MRRSGNLSLRKEKKLVAREGTDKEASEVDQTRFSREKAGVQSNSKEVISYDGHDSWKGTTLYHCTDVAPPSIL